MAGTLDRCPLNRGVRLIGVSVKRGSTVYIYIHVYTVYTYIHTYIYIYIYNLHIHTCNILSLPVAKMRLPTGIPAGD